MSEDGACLLMSGNMLSSQEAVRLLGKGQSYEMIEPNMPMTKGQTAGLPSAGADNGHEQQHGGGRFEFGYEHAL